MNPKRTNGRELVWRAVDGEAFLLDTRTGDYFSLNGVGTEVWMLLQEGCTAAEISAQLGARYGLDAATVAADVDDLLSELRAARLWETE